MTITYQSEVATSSFCGFAKLLKKWRGSAYKLVFKEMLVYMCFYSALSLVYRLALSEDQRRVFEKLSLHCAKYLDLIPLSFVLGFYVTFTVQRWWNQFSTIPWPDKTMNSVLLYVEGKDEKARMVRRTLMRYLNLSFVLLLQSISVAVKKRFPTLNHLVDSGFMTVEEKKLFESVNVKVNKYWIPLCWFINLLQDARREGRIKEASGVKHILEELNDFRSRCGRLWCFDWVTIPLVYTQVVTWATHLFFVGCVIGRQFLDPNQKYPGHEIDLYVPVFTFLQIFFYMGWLKVAEQLINPFGEDDDDFETNWLIDRNVQVSYLGVDDLSLQTPTVGKDLYWNNKFVRLPYTPASISHKIPNYYGSTMHLKVPLDESVQLCRDHEEIARVNEELRKRKHQDKVRSLGRCESLLPRDLLAVLNTGRRKFSFSRSGPTSRVSSTVSCFDQESIADPFEEEENEEVRFHVGDFPLVVSKNLTVEEELLMAPVISFDSFKLHQHVSEPPTLAIVTEVEETETNDIVEK